MSVKFSNNATTELASSIGTSDTSITVVDASKFPILTAGDYTYVTLDTDTASPTREIVRVTAISGNVLTVTRGQDGTSPASFSAGTKVELRLTAALLNDVAGANPSGEPIGFPDKSQTTITFDSGTRTFSITPTGASFDVYCKGVKYTYTTVQLVTIPNTTGLHFIYFSASGVLSTQMSCFTWEEHAPTAYVYWNATTQQAVYFGDERHGITLDWQTHEYLHRTRGAAIANGFSASNYTTTGLGATDADAQIDIGGGTFFDEDMQVDIVSTNTPVAGTWQQDLSGPARIPVLYLSGSAWVIDAPTNFPFKVVSSVPQYNLYSGGSWSTASVTNNSYFVSWILATNNLTYPVIAVISQALTNQLSTAEAMTFEGLNLNGFPSVEFRPLYKVIYQYKSGFTNSVKASTIAVYDLRSLQSAGVAAALVQDHGNLSGLTDDDHPQYVHTSEVRTPSAAVKNSFFPSQVGQTGKYLSTDGTNTVWEPAPSGSLSFTGDVTGTGSTGSSVSLTLAASGVVAGQYTKVTVDAKGRVTSATNIASSDVTTALGYTPYNSTNPAGYLTGITGAQVTTALGYTPPQPTGTGASGTWGISISGNAATVTSITSGQVTTALGFTPYNATNPSGYISGNQTITVSGDASGSGATSIALTLANSGVAAGTYTKVTVDAKGRVTTGASLASGDLPTYTGTITSSQVTTALGFTPYNATNPSGYITSSASISGNAATATNISNTGTVTLASATESNAITVTSPSYTTDQPVKLLNFEWYGNNFSLGNIRSGATPTNGFGVFYTASGGSRTEVARFGTGGTFNAIGAITQAGNQVLHAGNYNSYSPTLTGTGASGTWGISISGNAATAYGLDVHTGRNSDANKVVRTDSSGYLQTGWINTTSGSAGTTAPDRIYGSYDGYIRYYTPANLKSVLSLLDTSNYSNYALPLSGGTLSGATTLTGGRFYVSSAASSQSYNGTIHIRDNEATGSNNSFAGIAFSSSPGADYVIGKYSNGGTGLLQIRNHTGSQLWTMAIDGSVTQAGNLVINGGNQVLHAGNYTSYSPSLGGSGASGTWSISTTSDFLHSDRDFPSGTLITTDINYAVSSGDPFVLEIRGNSYGNIVPLDIQYQGYIYSDTIINHGGLANGLNISGLVAINNGGNLCFWFPSQGYWNGYYVKVYVPYGGRLRNRVTSITGSGKPTTAKEVGLSANIRQSLHSGNYTSYSPSLTGTGASGTWGINVTGTAGSIGGFNNPTTAPTANTIAYRDANGDIAAREIVLTSGLSSSTPTVLVSMFPTTNQLVRTTPAAVAASMGALTTSNYSSYALPLSGGTLTGTVYVGTSGSGSSARALRVGPSGSSPASFGSYSGSWRSAIEIWDNAATRMLHLTPPDGTNYGFSSIKSVGGGLRLDVGSDGSTNAINIESGGAVTLANSLTMSAGGIASNAWSSSTPNEAVRVFAPHGGSASWDGGIYGAIKIRLPNRAYNSMWNMTVKIYDYGGSVYEYQIGNYAYSAGGYQSAASFVGSGTSSPRTVRIGNDGTYDCVWIGETDSYWSYPVVAVTDFFAGFRNGNSAAWANNWNVSYATSFGTVATTITPTVRLASGSTINGDAILHASNYSSYALPLSGGTVTGALSFGSSTRQMINLWGTQYGIGVQSSTTYFRSDSRFSWHRGGSHNDAENNPGGGTVAMTLDGSSNLTVTANVTAYSDERVKTNWRQLDDGFLVKLSSVKSGIYDRTDAEITQVGVSAQSLRDVLPHAVIESDDGDLSVAYGNAALVSAVELAKELVMLKKELAELKSRLH